MGCVVSSLGVWRPFKEQRTQVIQRNTKNNTVEPHPTSCKLQRIWKNLAGRDKWLLGMRTVLQRTQASNFTRISLPYVGQHTTPTVTLRGRTRIFHTWRKHPPSGKTESSGYHHLAHVEQIISSLAPNNKTECLTTNTEETSHTTNNPTKQSTERQSCHTH